MQYLRDYLEAAHKHSIFHKIEILQSDLYGCFYCLRVFKSSEIVEWTDMHNPKGERALCPYCGIDSIIGDNSEFPISDKIFLLEMHSIYF